MLGITLDLFANEDTLTTLSFDEYKSSWTERSSSLCDYMLMKTPIWCQNVWMFFLQEFQEEKGYVIPQKFSLRTWITICIHSISWDSKLIKSCSTFIFCGVSSLKQLLEL